MSPNFISYLFYDNFWTGLFILRQFIVFIDQPIQYVVPSIIYHSCFHLFCTNIESLLGNTTLRLRSAFFLFRLSVSILFLHSWSYTGFTILAGYWTIGIWCYLRYQTSIRFVYQENTHNADLIQIYREKMVAFIRDYQPAGHVEGSHSILAHERREAERFVIERCIPNGARFRQPGANLTRFPMYIGRMHACRYPFENKDFQRNSSGSRFSHSRRPHIGCGLPGERCPERYNITYCLLSHVDYHLSRDQLCEMVTGPTFLIRHRIFDRELGAHGDNSHEATIRRYGHMCHMEVTGGQSYYHPFIDIGDTNNDTEGTIVGNTGAVYWNRLGDIGDTSIYYCYPHHGLFRVINDDYVWRQGTYRAERCADRSFVCLDIRRPPGNHEECTISAQLYETLYNHILFETGTDGNLSRIYNTVNNYCRSFNPNFKYSAVLTQALIHIIQRHHLQSTGECFRLSNTWDLGWAAPIYAWFHWIDEQLWDVHFDELIDELVYQRHNRHLIFNFLFRRALVYERRLPVTCPEPSFDRTEQPTQPNPDQPAEPREPIGPDARAEVDNYQIGVRQHSAGPYSLEYFRYGQLEFIVIYHNNDLIYSGQHPNAASDYDNLSNYLGINVSIADAVSRANLLMLGHNGPPPAYEP